MPIRPLKIEQILSHQWRFIYPSKQTRLVKRLIGALQRFDRGEVEEALEELRALINIYPNYIDGLHYLAVVLSAKKQYTEAIPIWQKAVDIGMKSLPAEFVMGKDLLEWVWPENRPFLRAYGGLGVALQDTGRVNEALDIFQNLLLLDPSDHQGIRVAAFKAAFSLKRPGVVLQIGEKFAHDTLVDTMYARPLALIQLGRLAEAEKAVMVAVENYPLVARELLKRRHVKIKPATPGYLEVGGADEAWVYWLRMGKHWKETAGALELLRSLTPVVGK